MYLKKSIFHYTLKIAVIFSLALSSSYARKARVMVYSNVSEEYTNQKESKERPEVESYLFLKGKYITAPQADSSLKRITYNDIMEVLRPQLEKKNYLPATDTESVDLLFVVHWGCMGGIDRLPDRAFANDGLDSGNGRGEEVPILSADDLERRQSLDTGGNYESAGWDVSEHTEMLGIYPSRAKNSDERNHMYQALTENRYFIAVVAYDVPTLKKTGEKKWLWSTRFSLSTRGTNFKDAHYSLARAASDYFGNGIDNVAILLTHPGRGETEQSELIVVGAEEKRPKKKK